MSFSDEIQEPSKLVRRAIVCIRIFLGIIFFTGGMSKLIHGYPGIMGPVWMEEELAKYGLGIYARFIAYSQAITGLLLLTRRFSTLAAVMLFPMLLNILMVTISLQWRGTPYIVGVFLLMNIFLLIMDYSKLKMLIQPDFIRLKKTQNENFFGWNLTTSYWIMAFILSIGGAWFTDISTVLAKTISLTGLIMFLMFPFLLKKLKSNSKSNG